MPEKDKAKTVNLRLRIRVDLLQKLEEAAAQDHRPVQTEIVRRLEESLRADRIEKAIQQTIAAQQAAMAARTKEQQDDLVRVLKAQIGSLVTQMGTRARPPTPPRRKGEQEKAR
jgi:hypothetical protein